MVLVNEPNEVLINSIDTDLRESLVVVGIPAFNEEKTIACVVLGAQKHADIIVVCDDGSTDSTGEIAERLGAVVIRHEQNSGYGVALQSLFKKARDLKADVLVTLDSDGQHDPAEIPRVVKPIEDDVAEVVLGSRFLDKKGTADMPKYRQLGVKVITKLSNRLGKNGVSDAQSGFRAYSKHALERLGDISEKGMSASLELLQTISKTGLSVCEVPISCKYSCADGAKTSSENAVAHGLRLVMSIIKLVVEDRPLQVLGIPGLAFLFGGISLGVWMLDMYGQNHVIVTNVALASISFVLIGFFAISTAFTLYAITRIAKK